VPGSYATGLIGYLRLSATLVIAPGRQLLAGTDQTGVQVGRRRAVVESGPAGKKFGADRQRPVMADVSQRAVQTRRRKPAVRGCAEARLSRGPGRTACGR
jgi:hypothetical protein